MMYEPMPAEKRKRLFVQAVHDREKNMWDKYRKQFTCAYKIEYMSIIDISDRSFCKASAILGYLTKYR